jgi:uncharacterized protein (TIGR03437 family)
VQVFVNGLAAPVLYVSQNQISAWIPYEISGAEYATFQVAVNNSKSNTVTGYARNSAPGIYTLAETGLGQGAILHADYSAVNDTSPARPGETVLLFMNGLGTVTPAVVNGAAASSKPLSYSDEYNVGRILVQLGDAVQPSALANVVFAGLTPGLAGLYQVNFTLPTSGLPNGDVYVYFLPTRAVTRWRQSLCRDFRNPPRRSIPAAGLYYPAGGDPRQKLCTTVYVPAGVIL